MGRNYASLTLSYSWEGFMQNMPPVTLGKKLYKTYLLLECLIKWLYTVKKI